MSKFGLVVIGAHIGVHILSDIEEYKDKQILLVEPVPHNLRILKENIANYKAIKVEPITIGQENKIRKFYFINEESVTSLGKHWASGIGSFEKQHILNHKTKRFNVTEDHIETIDIQSLTFNELMNKYSISEIDKLQIDVEGAELHVLQGMKSMPNKMLVEFNSINLKECGTNYKDFFHFLIPSNTVTRY